MPFGLRNVREQQHGRLQSALSLNRMSCRSGTFWDELYCCFGRQTLTAAMSKTAANGSFNRPDVDLCAPQ